jgi:hypothetical protein
MFIPQLDRRLWIAIGGGLLLITATVLGVVLIGSEPAPQSDSRDDLIKFVASEDFASLSEDKQRQYIQRLGEGGNRREVFRAAREQLTDEQRQQLRENMSSMMQQQMQKRVEEYFALPPEQRQQHLDATIDEMIARREQFATRRAERQAQGETNRPESSTSDAPNQTDQQTRRPRRGPSAERLKRRIENTDPETRARFVQYISDLRARMEERGVEFSWRGRRGDRNSR